MLMYITSSVYVDVYCLQCVLMYIASIYIDKNWVQENNHVTLLSPCNES